jgi:hypothetical protein
MAALLQAALAMSTGWPRRLALSLATASLLLTSAADAHPRREDALVTTAACDEAKASETARALFEHVEHAFDQYRKVRPLTDRVSVEASPDGGPEIRTHDAAFPAFRATFMVDADGSRRLLALSTRARTFHLPDGVRLGQSKAQLQAALGPPTAISRSLVLYQIGGEALSDVLFRFQHDRLTEVSWAYGQAD